MRQLYLWWYLLPHNANFAILLCHIFKLWKSTQGVRCGWTSSPCCDCGSRKYWCNNVRRDTRRRIKSFSGGSEYCATDYIRSEWHTEGDLSFFNCHLFAFDPSTQHLCSYIHILPLAVSQAVYVGINSHHFIFKYTAWANHSLVRF